MFAKNALRLLQNVCHTRYMVFRTREYLPYTVYEPRFVTASLISYLSQHFSVNSIILQIGDPFSRSGMEAPHGILYSLLICRIRRERQSLHQTTGTDPVPLRRLVCGDVGGRHSASGLHIPGDLRNRRDDK